MLSTTVLISLICICSISVLSINSHKSKLVSREESCLGFEGNQDLYGLGIRLGVYLQWIASWIANTLNPQVAADLHDVNSIFVLALICALCAGAQELRPVELYIMLLICNGYYFTVLNIFGLRVRLLNPRYLPGMIDNISKAVVEALKAKRRDLASASQYTRNVIHGSEQAPWSWKRILQAIQIPSIAFDALSSRIPISLHAASTLKFSYFSWLGVLWRIALASMVYLCSIVFWFNGWYTLPIPENCGSEVFFFGSRNLEGRLAAGFKVLSIVFAIPVLCLLIFASRALAFILQFSYLYILTARSNPEEMRPIIQLWMNRLDYFFRWGGLSLVLPLFPQLFLIAQLVQALQLVKNSNHSVENDSHQRLIALLQAHVSLASGTEEDRENERQLRSKDKIVLIISHVLTAILITCFITFVEKTISDNGISDVYTLGTTSQLIPFIVGLFTFLGALREICIRLLQNTYKNEQTAKFEIGVAGGEVVDVRLVQIKNETGRTSNVTSQGLQGPDGRWL